MALSGPPPLTAAGFCLIGRRARSERLDYITGGIAVVLSRRQQLANIELDDSLYERLAELAKANRREITAELNLAVDAYLSKKRDFPKAMAPKGYGLKPDEKKSR